ncbi:UDP-N-acetylglucosamine 2-epimerase (non-hydrolyzing) [Aeromicrobium panaciterrae]|uniref:non-hydrolyzing UDP-N-acetylglucosamine 2-epimerase n=1 Tax=Aeromicrobium panaciterrae TaxID=363861 RepID=UPI0031D5F239
MPLLMPVYGTRPEAIKMAPLVSAIERNASFDQLVAVTGQHREMLDQVNELFGIVPDVDLDIIQPRQTLAGITEKALNGLTLAMEEHKPDAVIVQGDTTTSMVAALAAFYLQIPVFHVEAGLRSGQRYSPFPEEVNRKMTSQLASLHFAPTPLSRNNLLVENIPAADVVVTGNTVIDALLEAVKHKVAFDDEALDAVADSGKPFILVTIHRRENQGEGMHDVGRALAEVATRHPDWTIVLPAHRNPVVREAVLPYVESIDNVVVTEPIDYGRFTHLLSLCTFVLTDSGGIQEEAPSLGKPVLVMRDNTERPEALSAGTVRLVGTGESRIVDECERLITDPDWYASMANAVNPYGDGAATPRHLAAMEQFFGLGKRVDDFAPPDDAV